MRYYDITHTLNGEVPIWPGDPLFSLEQIQTIGCGSDSNLHQLSMGVHTGTHVDAPYHFLSNGKRLGEMDLSYFIGDCLVLDCPCSNGTVEVEDLMGNIPSGTQRLLLKTPNSHRPYHGPFHTSFCGVSPDAARYIVSQGIRCLGIDYNSVGPFGPDCSRTHRILLETNSMVILEALNLQSIRPGMYTLFCLPLKLDQAEGAPARVLLLDRDSTQ